MYGNSNTYFTYAPYVLHVSVYMYIVIRYVSAGRTSRCSMSIFVVHNLMLPETLRKGSCEAC